MTIIYIKKGYSTSAYTVDNLRDTNSLTIGQAFSAVAHHYKKTKEDYPRWCSYKSNPGEFMAINAVLSEATDDYEKIQLACEWLGENGFN